MSERKGKKKRKKPAGAESPVRTYHHTPLAPIAVAVVLFIFWGVVIFAMLDTNPFFLLWAIGGSVVLVLGVVLVAVGRFELDEHGIAIIRPMRSPKRFKWSELEFVAASDSLHLPDEGHAPRQTTILRAGGGTAFSFSSWVTHYHKMRDDVRHHLREASARRH